MVDGLEHDFYMFLICPDLMVIQWCLNGDFSWDIMGLYLVGGDWNMTFMRFHSVGNDIFPTDELFFFREVGIPPTSLSIHVYPMIYGCCFFLSGD